mmetsp:Transcript_29358/g.44301  ORF Transcript_29358/g.44301 Transcript_29358/m.44301 type:complete len:312 (-) Transcript_29358:168-1103(-)
MAKASAEAYLFVSQAEGKMGDASRWEKVALHKIQMLEELRRCIAPLDVQQVAEAAKEYGGRVKDFKIALDDAISKEESKPKDFGALLKLETVEDTKTKEGPRFQRMAVPRHREVEEIERISLLVRFDTQGKPRHTRGHHSRLSRGASSRFSSRGNSAAREGSHRRGTSRVYESMASAALSQQGSNRPDDDIYSEYEIQLDQLVATRRGPSRGPTARSSARPHGQQIENLTQSFFLIESRIDLTKPEEALADSNLQKQREEAGGILRTDQRLLLNKQLRDAGFTVIFEVKFLYTISKLKLKLALGQMEQGNS